MTIRFKCPHCQKGLSVKDHLAGKKAACPVCKKVIAIPTPISAPVDVESYAAEALADKPEPKAEEPVQTKTIEFTCSFCDEQVTVAADLGGKQTPCPHCKNIVKVPRPDDKKPKDWRTTLKTGPSAALSNQPEQLSDAWGTEQKGRVSRQAMEEAGALPEPDAKPLGVAGWIKRGLKIGLAGAAIVLLIGMLGRARHNKQEKDARAEAAKFMNDLPPLQKAEVFRAFGELDVRNRVKRDKARDNFNQARGLLHDIKDDNDERDLLLIKLVDAQIELGGNANEAMKGVQERFEWTDNDFVKELTNTLNDIHGTHAKASALRYLTVKCLEKKKPEIAMTLINPVANGNEALKAQQIGIYYALGLDMTEAGLPAFPNEKQIDDNVARVGYTEGLAFKKDFAKALALASAEGPAAGQLDACVAAAAIILADTKNKDRAKDALPFIEAGFKAMDELLPKQKSLSWSMRELLALASRTEASAKVKEMAGKLPASEQPRVFLELYLAKLADSNSPAETALDDALGPAKSPTRAFGWEALARHNTRLGSGSTVRAIIDDPEETDRRPFFYIGLALGEQDRVK